MKTNKKSFNLGIFFMLWLCSYISVACLSLSVEEVSNYPQLKRVYNNTKQIFDVNRKEVEILGNAKFFDKSFSLGQLTPEIAEALKSIKENRASYIVQYYGNNYRELLKDIKFLRSQIQKAEQEESSDLDEVSLQYFKKYLQGLSKLCTTLKHIG